MSPDKNKPDRNSTSGGDQTHECSESYTMEYSSGLALPCTSDVTLPSHGTTTNIPSVTASQPTLKCSISDQMKTFDPGEEGGIERLTNNHSGNSTPSGKNSSSSNSSSNVVKGTIKNYKAGSKINKLADMLAKRSQNMVEVKQNNASDMITDISSVPKVEDDSVIMNNVSNVLKFERSLKSPVPCFEKTMDESEVKLYRKSRRKSVPNQSCNLQEMQFQSTSKSCSDFSEIFPSKENGKPEFNALGGALIKLQTEESTKKKLIRKNLKNVELPLILPERKRRSSLRSENLISCKVVEKLLDVSSDAVAPAEEVDKNKESPNEILTSSLQSPNCSFSSTKLRKDRKVKQRKSKRLVENSTQTGEVEFLGVIKPKPETSSEEVATNEVEKASYTYACLYCAETFALGSPCKAHEKTHSLKGNRESIKCQYCAKKFCSLEELKSHSVQKHSNKYSYCAECDVRFATKEKFSSHNGDVHVNKNREGVSPNATEEEIVENASEETKDDEEKASDKKGNKQNNAKGDLKIDVSYDYTKKSSVSPRNVQKCSPKETKTEEQLLEMEMLFYSHLTGNIQENLKNHLDGKIDQSGNPIRTDQAVETTDVQVKTKASNLLSVASPSAGVAEVQVSRAPSPYQTRSKTPNPLPPTPKKFKKLPNWQQKFWEKYNFPTNYRYEHRFWDKNYLNTDKSAFYLKDLSCLDIKTQLTMRENIKKLDEVKETEESGTKAGNRLKFPDYLSLVPRTKEGNDEESGPESQKSKKLAKKEESKKSFKSPGSELPVGKTRRKLSSDNTSAVKRQAERGVAEGLKMVTRRQSSLDLLKDEKEESSRKRKGSLDSSEGQRMILRRQTSLDNLGSGLTPSVPEKTDQVVELNLNKGDLENTPLSPAGSAEISGEWVRPRSYLCGTCCAKFTNLWELEDHKWVSHPNVWCTHYEFEDEKIDKLFQKNEDAEADAETSESSALSKSKLTDLYKRYLLPHGSLKTAKLVPKSNFPEQCTKCKKNCMNASEMHKHMLDCGGDTTWFLTMYSSPMTIKRKWRPFGSRRRKQIGRRDVKRNIPSTPTLRSYHFQHRIRTKPGDVESIQKMLANLPEKRARRAINFDEIKTRSQATIHSNRLLRKRFKSSFSNNFLKFKTIKQKRQLKQGRKESSSKSTTDTSSESTPIGSPKRRNKLKENVQLPKEDNSRDGSSETSEDSELKSAKKKSQSKRKELPTGSGQQGVEGTKVKSKSKKGKVEKEKPSTRSNGLPSGNSSSSSSRPKRKVSLVKEEVLDETEIREGVQTESKEQKELIKSSKNAKKRSNSKTVETKIKEEVPEASDGSEEVSCGKAKEAPKKIAKNVKTKSEESGVVDEASKKKFKWASAQSNSILRLNQRNKEKTELLKRIKKKFQNSKRILELKEAKCGSRRSLRIKSLQQVEVVPEVLSGEGQEECRKGESVVSEKDSKVKIPVSSENVTVKKAQKMTNGKNCKGVDQNPERECSDKEGGLIISRRSSRSLRNSVSSEGKPEVLPNGEANATSQNPRPEFTQRLRRNSKNLCEADEPPSPDVLVESVIISKKSLRVQNERGSKGSREKPHCLPAKGQMSSAKKNRLPLRGSRGGEIKSEEVSETGKSDSNKPDDLEEMPILAKVEPIRGKVSRKSEKEIPVLMPVEKEPTEESGEETPVAEDSISFQVIKKRRKTWKEVTPLKIVKKVEGVFLEKETGCNGSFRGENGDVLSQEDAFEIGKSKRRKMSDAPSVGKSVKADAKKYFLGICPSEIDKGRIDPQEESGSDSEPLITLIINQSQKENKSQVSPAKEEEKEEEEVVKMEKEDPEEVPRKKSKKKKKKSGGKKTPTETTPPELLVSEEKSESESRFKSSSDESKEIIPEEEKRKKKVEKKAMKGLRMTVTLREPTLKIIDKSAGSLTESKWTSKLSEPKTETESQARSEESEGKLGTETALPERRSRRISKETKSSSEFVIDDPLLLVDELWSDLDSDSDGSKKRSKKGKKRSVRKKTTEEKKVSHVILEELLRNFGENKERSSNSKCSGLGVAVKKRRRIPRSAADARKVVESRKVAESYRRLSLKLFRFNKPRQNFGNRGEKLSEAKRALREKLDEIEAKASNLPDLRFLAAEIKENPVQVIQCGVQKLKPAKRGHKRIESKGQESEIQLKISLPLESLDNMPILNNNHLTELVVEESKPCAEEVTRGETSAEKEVQEEISVAGEAAEVNESKNKTKRSEVIDKIFYCEICKTYYYSSSQLRIHKLSNRHKLKESELLHTQEESVRSQKAETEIPEGDAVAESVVPVEESPRVETLEAERLNEDTLEMPTLEGPFIENPLTRVPPNDPPPPPPQPAIVTSFAFSQESLKDIQRAIGCTDEEMLILTLLGENTIEIENDILDVDSCKSVQSKSGQKGEGPPKENEKANGALKVDLKQRMTSALACLVNKAVFNLLQKYETAAKSAVNPEALSLLGKLSSLSRRKNIIQLNELLKKQNDGEPSVGSLPKELEKKEPAVSYKYQCTICGSRFEKASTRECHISRSHKGKAKKSAEDAQALQTTPEDEWNDPWSYDPVDDHPGSTTASQFWCSDCGINFQSPQEVLEHQKLEHQAGSKEVEQVGESGPLQSSTIGSSDEIMEGKKTRRRPKLFSSEELDQQRIIANNELRKLDRKFSNKSKSGKIKWGMDALRFTVEKENKMVVVKEEKAAIPEEATAKPPADIKNIDLVPKLNLSRTSNIPEFKVIQKNSFKNRFQKIIDNKLKRRSACPSQQEAETEEMETEVMLVPVVVKKKNKRQKVNKFAAKKEESEKPLDVYDFNESESEGEPVVYSHIKKPAPSPTKLRLIKVKEGPSKNKADSTTKDLAPDDYDSEDSLPLSVVKRSKPGEEEDEKEEKMSEDGVEKSDGILEQVEYLIEQLENETGSSKKENESEKESDSKKNEGSAFSKEETKEDSVDSALTAEEGQDGVRVSVANEFLELGDLSLKNRKSEDGVADKFEAEREEDPVEKTSEEVGGISAEPESSQSTFDEEDSLPLLLMSKKAEETRFDHEEKKCDENITDVSTTASEDVQLFRGEENKSSDAQNSIISQPGMEESLPPVFSSSENEGGFGEKSNKPFESLNGNVIYCRNESMSDFGTDLSDDGLIDSNFEKAESLDAEKNFIEEVTEKEDVVIVCSKGSEEERSVDRKRFFQRKKEVVRKKKKRFPLLTATIEENNFRKSESPKLNKEVIMRKIWNPRKPTEDSSENEEGSYTSADNENSVGNLPNEESQTEIEKEIIVKKIWSRKKFDHEEEFGEKLEEKLEDVKINQTEISDEVVIKCGPKAKTSPKRRKSRISTNESSKDTIMRKIWSGRCTFQTKAALKTYDSDMIPNCKENEASERETKPKRRGRPSGLSGNKRSKTESEANKDDEDDLDSLLEEIEREQLEKAIRSEFLQLRRSEKANVELKEGSNSTVGLFAETSVKHKKEASEKKRRKVRKKLKHPRQSILKRKKYLKRPVRRIVPSEDRIFSESTDRSNPDAGTEQSENSLEDKKANSFGEEEARIRNRKHKKHRHKHHHHKHKHKKSKHHKCVVSKHKSKHKFESGEEDEQEQGEGEGEEEEESVENADSFTILEKICQDIPNQIESESQFQSRTSKEGTDSDANTIDSKVDDTASSFSFETKGKDYPEFEEGLPGKGLLENENRNIYDFEEVPDFAEDGLKDFKM